MNETINKWDLFISHASEDKDEVARPLTNKLKARGLEVWLDEQELTIGDILGRKIDEGLGNSTYGVVILSPHFFEKHWPQSELDGLAAREDEGEKVILPVWHQITKKEVTIYSSRLAAKLGISTEKGLDNVVCEICKVVGKCSPQTLNPSGKRIHTDLSMTSHSVLQTHKVKPIHIVYLAIAVLVFALGWIVGREYFGYW